MREILTEWICANTRSNTCGACLDDVVRKTPRPGVTVQRIFPGEVVWNASSSILFINDIRLFEVIFSLSIGGSIFIIGPVLCSSSSSSLLAVWCSTGKLLERINSSLSLAVGIDSSVEPNRWANCVSAVVWALTWRYRRRFVWPWYQQKPTVKKHRAINNATQAPTKKKGDIDTECRIYSINRRRI